MNERLEKMLESDTWAIAFTILYMVILTGVVAWFMGF
jgi:hypothetical protein